MYLLTYIKQDGKRIEMLCNSTSEVRNMINTLSDRIAIGRIIAFNVEVL